MSNQVATINNNDLTIGNNTALTDDQVTLLKDTICKGATDNEFKQFIYVCKKTGLDPFTKQIYAVKRWNSKLGRDEMTIQTGIDGFRVVAERSGKYAGQVGPYWCGSDGKWVDVWLSNQPPVAAKVGVLRKDFKDPLWAVAKFESYKQVTNKGDLNSFWKKFPDLMIAKVAESAALRKGFPHDLSGVYAPEEMPEVEETTQRLVNQQQPAKLELAGHQDTQKSDGNKTVQDPLKTQSTQSQAAPPPTIKNHAPGMQNDERPKPPPQKPQNPSFDDEAAVQFSEYTITFGAYTGKKLKEFKLHELKNMIEKCYKQRDESKKEFLQSVQDFVYNAEALVFYLENKR